MRGWRSLGNDASLHNKGSLFTLMLGPPGTFILYQLLSCTISRVKGRREIGRQTQGEEQAGVIS